MKTPNHIDFTPEQIDDLIERIDKRCLAEEDYPLLANLIRAITWLNLSLQEKKISIRRLRSVFGIKTESAKKLFKLVGDPSSTDASESAAKSQSETDPATDKNKGSKKGHGHRPASDYSGAKIIHVAHEMLKKGGLCPDCSKGRLSRLPAGSVIRIVGSPSLQVEIYKPERLRCSLCGKIFTAKLPEEVSQGSRADASAKAVVSFLKYKAGVPFHRQERIQEAMGSPLSASELWSMTKDVADVLEPIHACLLMEAAKGDCIHNDDTTHRILSILQEQKRDNEKDEKTARKGIFTTAILSKLDDRQIALFFTGRQHAGENLNDVLKARPEGLSIPIQECDALSRNVPNEAKTHVANCLSHARRNFYELVDFWPKEVTTVLGLFGIVFANDRRSPKDPEERLAWHREHSSKPMKEMKRYCNELLATKKVEPNCSLGKAVAYLNNHWEELTLFLRMPGVPLTNNSAERLIKGVVLNRKNAYFYRNEAGARVADILMSIIETCILNHVNPYDYLLTVQQHKSSVAQAPHLWLPWNYAAQIKGRPPP